MNIIKVPIEKVIPWEKNPRGIKTKDFERLKRQILELGVYKPLLAVRENGHYVVLGGNMRIRALKDIGVKEIDISVVKAKTEAEKIKYALSDNDRAGFYEEDKLAELVYPYLDKIKLEDYKIDLDETINLKQAIEQFGPDINGNAGDLLSPKDEELKKLGALFDLRKDIRFDGAGKFDMPILREDRLLNIPAPQSWAGPIITNKDAKTYLYNYGSDSTINLDFSRTIISFYTDDARFERLWFHTSEIAKRFINRKVKGLVSPNFSTYFSWPRALRLYNTFRSRWVARYMQEAGIPIIPDISGDPADIEFIFDGIPFRSPVCIQVHRAGGDSDEKIKKNTVIQATFDIIKPARVWIYGREEKIADFPCLKNKLVEFITPREWIHKKFRLDKKQEELNG